MLSCFQCAQEIIELPIGDPTRDSDRYSYAPSFVVEVLPGGPGGAAGPCRATVLCWTCMHTLDIDMWLSEEGWNTGKPAVQFEQLPIYNHDDPMADEPQTYAHAGSWGWEAPMGHPVLIGPDLDGQGGSFGVVMGDKVRIISTNQVGKLIRRRLGSRDDRVVVLVDEEAVETLGQDLMPWDGD